MIGNDAVHPGQIDLRDDRETALELARLVNIITDVTISQPKHIEAMYEKLFALALLRRQSLKVGQNAGNDPGLLDAGDDAQLAVATDTRLDLDAEHSLQPSRPVRRARSPRTGNRHGSRPCEG